MKCKFCGDPISEDHDYRYVGGWERIHRPAGGTNGLRGREPTEQLACRWCIDKLAAGLSVEQTSFL